jgi:hypothetical protein
MSELSRRQIFVGVAAAASVVPALTSDRAHAEQPHMDSVLDALKTARRELDAANPDKGGQKGIEWAKHR